MTAKTVKGEYFTTPVLLSICVQTIRAILRVNSEPLKKKNFSFVISRFRAEEMPERHSTRTAYESMLRRWIEPRWGNVPVDAIQTSDVDRWLREMECAPKTRRHRKVLLHTIFNAAVRQGLVAKNPVSLARVKGGTKRRRRPVLISLAELRSVLAHLREPFRQMVMLAALLGLRASEVVALRWSDFDFPNKTLQIQRGSVSGRVAGTKTANSEETLPLDDAIAEEMLRYRRKICPGIPGQIAQDHIQICPGIPGQNRLDRIPVCPGIPGQNDPEEHPGLPHSAGEDGWCFPSPVTGGPMHQDSIRTRHLIPAGRAAKLSRPLGWHAFRHSYRRWLDEAGTPPGVIKELMRHTDIRTTFDVYGAGTLTDACYQANRTLADLVRFGQPELVRFPQLG